MTGVATQIRSQTGSCSPAPMTAYWVTASFFWPEMAAANKLWLRRWRPSARKTVKTQRWEVKAHFVRNFIRPFYPPTFSSISKEILTAWIQPICPSAGSEMKHLVAEVTRWRSWQRHMSMLQLIRHHAGHPAPLHAEVASSPFRLI